LLPSPNCQRIRNERYIEGTEPSRVDDQFVTLTIDQATGLTATDNTSNARRSERIYWLLPPEYHDWMVSQGIPLPPPPIQTEEAAATTATIASGPLILAAPTSNTAYQIHPGVPLDRQRIEVSGYVADGTSWVELRLIVDGQILAEAQNAARLRAWWQFTPGNHTFWLEGKRTAASEKERTTPALVVIESDSNTTVTSMSN
jgi:hypothetical protein